LERVWEDDWLERELNDVNDCDDEGEVNEKDKDGGKDVWRWMKCKNVIFK